MTNTTTDPTPDNGTKPATRYQPTARDLILLELPSAISVSPSGTRAAVSIRRTNWQANRYELVCYIYDVKNGTTYPLNRSGSVQQVEWLDEQTLAVLKEEYGKTTTTQIWLYENLIGEGWQVTDHQEPIEWFAPFADGLLYRAKRAESKADKERSERFGTVIHFEQEESKSALYYVDLRALRTYEASLRSATADEAKALVRPVIELSQLLPEPRAIRSVVSCPSGTVIYLNCRQRDDLVYYRESSSYQISLDPAAAVAAHQTHEAAKRQLTTAAQETLPDPKEGSCLGTIRQLPLPPGADIVAVAPDGQTLLLTHQERDAKIFTRTDLWLLDADAARSASDANSCLAAMRNISAPLDRDLFGMQWTAQGIFAGYADGTAAHLVRFDAAGAMTPLDCQGITLASDFHVGKGGDLGFIGANATRFTEAYLAAPTTDALLQPQQISNAGEGIASWQLGTVETIRWASKDGTEIEGVLRKPVNFDPAKQYPLLFIVHGGPRGVSLETLLSRPDMMYYPAVQFANAEMLVLYPNYRGSTGRGQAFTELNVNNLGIGDLWDLESAIDHLAALGWVDESRIGCMGWSQGGYISAFAGLHSDRFAAVSVGAGISDWYTYHISNDIPYFTTDYLSGSPFQNREFYAPTAPISNLANACTPMLIQHGTDDHRVPLSNAMELYRGLQAMGVPVELYLYPGMSHPITKPRENHAVLCQNWDWFAKYLLGEGMADTEEKRQSAC